MSNPKDDLRGSMLTSCHSFNYTDCDYNCGCSGYARDNVTFIVFTASDPNIPETLNNRKTTRQLFMYKVGNGFLLQSRLYNTYGGTSGSHAESKLYRDLVQRELSELEGVPNLWKTYTYCENELEGLSISRSENFGGYCDWKYPEFDAKISIRNDHSLDFKVFTVGTHGLCISCGDEISNGLYCHNCSHSDCQFCHQCQTYCSETWDVFNSNGDIIHVCEHCLDEHYRLCEHCNEYYPKDSLTIVGDGSRICSKCLADDFAICDECDEYFLRGELSYVTNSLGDKILLCQACRHDMEVPA